MDEIQLPPEVLEAYHKLKAIAPTALIAGGYLRDHFLGVSAKDIDVFTEGPVDIWELKAAFPGAKLEPFTEFLQYSSSEVQAVWDLGVYGGLPLQLIELEPGMSPVDRAKAHDFGICQIWSFGSTVEFTRAFLQDVVNSTFTLTNCASAAEYDRSMKRFHRISTKYPGFTVVIPEEFKEWQQPSLSLTP